MRPHRLTIDHNLGDTARSAYLQIDVPAFPVIRHLNLLFIDAHSHIAAVPILSSPDIPDVRQSNHGGRASITFSEFPVRINIVSSHSAPPC